jgi:hypothetical protein
VPAAFALLVAVGGAGCGRPSAADSPLFPAVAGSRWGYIDGRGKTIIAPRFEHAGPFSEGLAAVSKAGRWGYIDRNGAEIIPFRFRAAGSFRNGVAIVDTGLPRLPLGVIDPRGAWVVEPSFRELQSADGPDGLLLGAVEPGTGRGFYDREGILVHGPYAFAFPFAEGRARVRHGSSDGIIDEEGNLVPQPRLTIEGTQFSEGLIAVRQDRRLGYMDRDGTLAIQPRFDQGGAFAEGLAAVQLEGRWMFINAKGVVTAELPAGVTFAYPLADGLSLVTADRDGQGRKMGYVDRNGRWAIKPQWDEAASFRDGLARVGTFKGGRFAYIDRAGKVVWETSGVDPALF